MIDRPASTGVLFYCDRTVPIPPLTVALWTLSRHYKGRTHIIFGREVQNWFVAAVSRAGPALQITHEVLPAYDFPEWTQGRRGSWCQKPFAIRRSPFEITLYLDCDHLFTDWGDDIWSMIAALGLCSAHDKQTVRRGRKIIEDVRAVAQIDLKTYRPVNGGCIGYLRDHGGLNSWIEYMTLFTAQRDSRLLRNLAEEFGLGLALNLGFGGWLEATVSRMKYPHPGSHGFHLNDGRYLLTPAWQQELVKCFAANFLEVRHHAAEFIECDRRIRGFLPREHVDSIS